MNAWPFGDLQPFAYNVVMIDPNWRFKLRSAAGEAKAPQAHYHCDSIETIRALPVRDLAADDCVLWLWATNPMLDQAIDTLKAWEFQFATAGHWSKKTKHGKQAFGTGYILRCAGEPFLIGTRGSPKFAKNVRSVVEGLIRENSRKPDEAHRAAERLVPNAWRRADLFARQRRRLWDGWGDELDHFPPEEGA